MKATKYLGSTGILVLLHSAVTNNYLVPFFGAGGPIFQTKFV